MLRIIFFIIISMLVISCQHKKTDDDIIISAEDSYSNGLRLFNKQSYKESADSFGKVYFQHPGLQITPYAELMEAYSLYSSRQYQEAVDVLDNFISIHPAHIDISYAYYLKGLSFYMQISDIYHDQDITLMAKEAFEELLKRFPGGKYSLDAALKLDLINDHLAGKEMAIGRYYQNNYIPIGAIARFQEVVTNYQTTTYVTEALYRLVESYSLLGIKSEAQKYADVLAHNYPDSTWNRYASNILSR